MRVASTAVSFTVHVVLVVAAVWATARVATPASPPIIILDSYRTPIASARARAGAPNVPDGVFPLPPDLPTITPESIVPATPILTRGLLPSGPDWSPAAPSASGGEPVDVRIVDDPPVLLAGPVPAYPELLRQAGIEGRIVLEAVVDTTGRVEGESIVVVSAGHPGFVDAARQALMGTLFRPGRMTGRAVRVRVRLPFEFVLRRNR